jgi:hypothetical protein
MQLSCLAPVTMEAGCSSETSVYFQFETQSSIPKDTILYIHCCENRKLRVPYLIYSNAVKQAKDKVAQEAKVQHGHLLNTFQPTRSFLS